MEPTSREGADKLLARAADLVANGDREAAIDLLGKSRALYVDNAEIPYMAGKLYFAKLWWTDGLKNFRDAVRLEPRYKTDPELIKTILKGFITTPSYNDELAAFLRNEIGAPAVQYLEETSRDHPNATIEHAPRPSSRATADPSILDAARERIEPQLAALGLDDALERVLGERLHHRDGRKPVGLDRQLGVDPQRGASGHEAAQPVAIEVVELFLVQPAPGGLQCALEGLRGRVAIRAVEPDRVVLHEPL